jgi:hypothetical protein
MSKRFTYYGSFASATWFSDDFGMPTAAYSLRKLTPNAVNCIRVRRSSDNAEQDIGFVANVPNSPIDTTALLAFVGAGNGFVTTWYDQSTGGVNFTQSTGNLQPQIVASGAVSLLNSLPTITLTAAQYWERAVFTNKILDIYCVTTSTQTLFVKFTGVALNGAGYSYVSQNGSSSSFLFESYGTPTLFANNTQFTGTTRNDVFNFLNGTKIEVQQRGNTTSWTFFRFGWYTSGAEFAGSASELIFYDTDVSANRTNRVNNQNTYYNVF